MKLPHTASNWPWEDLNPAGQLTPISTTQYLLSLILHHPFTGLNRDSRINSQFSENTNLDSSPPGHSGQEFNVFPPLPSFVIII